MFKQNSFCLEFFGAVGVGVGGGERRMKCSKNKKLIQMSSAMLASFLLGFFGCRG